MIFKQLDNLIYLSILPLFLVVAYFLIFNKKQRLKRLMHMTQISRLNLFDFRRSYLKIGLIFLGILFLLIANLRPQYGRDFQKFTRKGLDVFVAVDVSLSMSAQDIMPSRFDYTKQEILHLTELLRGDRFGLIPFSGTAFVQLPLTSDYSAIRMFMDDLKVGMISRSGTNLEEAVKVATDAFSASKGSRILVLVSDGESFEGSIDKIIQKAKKDNIIIYTIGVGSTNGEPLPIRSKTGSVLEYKKDKQNNLVLSKLNESSLIKLAESTGGVYFKASNDTFVMDQLYKKIKNLEREKQEKQMFYRYKDRYQYFLFLAFIFLLIDFLYSSHKPKKMQWKGRI